MKGEITKEYPPKDIYERCVEKFGVDFKKGIIFAYEDKIHCYKPEELTPDVLVHERTHIAQQQKMGADDWWEKYLTDDKFRLKEELEAYYYQYKYLMENSSRNIRRFFLKKTAEKLSGKTYGHLMKEEQVIKTLKDLYAKNSK